MLGSLQLLKLLNFCSMIFGYEFFNKEGEELDPSYKQRPAALLQACLGPGSSCLQLEDNQS